MTSAGLEDHEPEADKNQVIMRRFWKDVGIEKRGDKLAVTLDKRALKTPSGSQLLVPADRPLAAAIIASEWDSQEIITKAHALPMTAIVSRTIDDLLEGAHRHVLEQELLNFLNTDTVCFFHDEPEPLHRLQTQYWVPLLQWARETFDIEINVSNSILSVKQPARTREVLQKVIESLDAWELAALERTTNTTKSLIIALALVKKHLTVEEAALVACVEVNSQIERWGEVEDTHDVDYQDVRRQLGSAALILAKQP